MLTTDDLARLQAALEAALQWPPSNRDAFIEVAEAMLPELTRVYAAVLGAPMATVEWQRDVGMVLGACRLSSDLIGKRVRLVPLATAKGGES